MNAIERAVEICGGQKQLADAVQVSQSFVSQWVNENRPVPAKRCRAIEKATGGLVTCHDLRPDVFGEKTETA